MKMTKKGKEDEAAEKVLRRPLGRLQKNTWKKWMMLIEKLNYRLYEQEESANKAELQTQEEGSKLARDKEVK